MKIRTYQPGDESSQAEIFNAAAAALPKFKAATADDVLRRTRDADFDPQTHFYVEEGGALVAYCNHLVNGRVGYPWCRPGHEALQQPLFEAVLASVKKRGIPVAFAAYRDDWKNVLAFFEQQGFQKKRDIVNYVLDLLDMPTRSTGPIDLSPPTREDLPKLLELAPMGVRSKSVAEFEKFLFANPYFSKESCFVLRSRDGEPSGAGILVQNEKYAHPRSVDANMPCFRLGAFGTEGLPAKRIDGMFSLLISDRKESTAHALVLLEHAAQKQEDRDESTLAAQVASDAGNLPAFYNRYFRRQGSFPVYEKSLS